MATNNNNNNNNVVTYICKRTVVSTKPIEPGKYFPLSVLDRCMEKNHIRMVYYYQTTSPSLGEQGEFGKITKDLRETLSEMLSYYPIVTGRLVRDDEIDEKKWKVKCNDAGVRVIEAKAKGSVEDWLKNMNREKEHMLVYWEDMYHKPYYWSTFYVQVTEFEEGGLAIGLSCFHLLADSTSATNFMKTWSDISLGNKIMSLPLFHPLPSTRNIISNHQPYSELINHYKSLIERPIPINEEKYTTISLGFPAQMVNACISKAQLNGPSRPITTPFEALAGLFWISISKIKGLQNGLIDMSICLDARKELGLDYGFFGNTMIYGKVHYNANLEGNIFVQATRSIGEVVENLDNEGVMHLIEWLEKNEKKSPRIINGPDLICASLENVDPYLSVFHQDWFKPVRVSCYIEPVLGEGQVLILPGAPEEGPLSRVAMVTLKEEEAIKLCEDDLISQFSPTILMKC